MIMRRWRSSGLRESLRRKTRTRELMRHYCYRSRKELRPLVTRFRMKSGTIVFAHCTPNNSNPELVTGWITKCVISLLPLL